MYSNKRNVLQLAALLRAHGIRRIVIAPGSRNIPLAQTFTACPDFECYSVTDERSAGFFALGLALEGGRPAAVCCTSGSALLNIHPAVAEACYQQVPLLVISADRPAAWIGQMDGQTLPQPGVFGALVRRSADLPEVQTDEEAWHCNRLVNEALLELEHRAKGPVHINVPISEPLFDFSVMELPDERIIRRYDTLEGDEVKELLRSTLSACKRRLVICGQTSPEDSMPTFPQAFVHCCESLCNSRRDSTIQHFDAILHAAAPEEQEALMPRLVITCGGHIVSKRLKQWLRRNPSLVHWHISPDGDTPDLFCHLSTVFEMKPADFFARLNQMPTLVTGESCEFIRLWHDRESAYHDAPSFGYSEMGAIEKLISLVQADRTQPVTLHLANSSAVRYAQLCPPDSRVTVRCNRGVNGIEGSLSTAIGYAAASSQINYIIIGDLSFFYDMNALWNGHIRDNVRILLLNNGGGEIFHALPGLKMSERTHEFVTAPHVTTAKGWAGERGFDYRAVRDETGLEGSLGWFTAPSIGQPRLLEVFTDKDEDVRLLKDYYHRLKD